MWIGKRVELLILLGEMVGWLRGSKVLITGHMATLLLFIEGSPAENIEDTCSLAGTGTDLARNG